MKFETIRTMTIKPQEMKRAIEVEILRVHSDGDFGIRTPYAVHVHVEGFCGAHAEASTLNAARRLAQNLTNTVNMIIDDVLDSF